VDKVTLRDNVHTYVKRVMWYDCGLLLIASYFLAQNSFPYADIYFMIPVLLGFAARFFTVLEQTE